MRDALRHFVAEFIGTFALVFLGGLSIMMANGTGAPASVALLIIGLVHGFVFAAMVTAMIHVSGHFNPAITLGFVVARRISGAMAGIFVAGQVIGAITAGYVLKMTVPLAAFNATRGGGQIISLSVTGGQASARTGRT